MEISATRRSSAGHSLLPTYSIRVGLRITAVRCFISWESSLDRELLKRRLTAVTGLSAIIILIVHYARLGNPMIDDETTMNSR